MFNPAQKRVLVLAPRGRDAELIVNMLCNQGFLAEAALSMDRLCREIGLGAGCAVITEEALTGPPLDVLKQTLSTQQPWSDLPLILLTVTGEPSSAHTWNIVRQLEPGGNVSLLERPLRALTLSTAVQVAIRSRTRQYEVRALHENLERRVSERTVELQRINKEAEGFNYSISHDLRAPLRAIISTSKILLDEYGENLSQEARSLLTRQASAGHRLAELIDALLKLSRISRQDMQHIDFDLSALAKSVASDVLTQHWRSPCKVEVEDGLEAHGDPLLVRFVLQNLIDNACKFSPDGGMVHVGRVRPGPYFVSDEGVGFEMQYQEKVFQPFERLVREEEFPGTGIGLTNVKRIIERHEGAVWAQSEPGKGTTFYFTLEGGDVPMLPEADEAARLGITLS